MKEVIYTFLHCPQKMEHLSLRCLYRSHFKTKLLVIVDLLVFALFFGFTTLSFHQEESVLLWLPIFIQFWGCFALRMLIMLSIKQYKYRNIFLVLHLLMYFLGFLMLQNLRTKTPALEMNEEIVVLIYLVVCFFLGALIDNIHKNVLYVNTIIAAWVSTTIVMVHILLCFEGILKGGYCISLDTLVCY